GGMDAAVEPSGMSLWRVTGETMAIHPTHLTTNLSRFGAKAFSQMNSSMVVKIGIVATVTVGGMDAAVEPIGIYLRRVTGETMTIHAAHLTTNLSHFGATSF
ncbi:MAG: hypothetical protein ACRAU9_07260, partial [Shewanella xiamenensis]